MGKEALTIEVDAELMEALRSAGVDPKAYVERMMARVAAGRDTADERAGRAKAWREANRAEIDWYNRFVEEGGLWSDALRQF